MANKLLCVLFVISLLVSGCTKNNVLSNEYVEVEIPIDYKSLPLEKDDVLYLEKDIDGLACIISIDNIQHYVFQDNAETIEKSTPQDILKGRLTSIEDETKSNPNFHWKNFELVGEVEPTQFKGYLAAEGVFTVDENVGGQDVAIHRKIKRMVIFKENDIWNVVLAPSQSSVYDREMKELDHIMESLKIK